MSDLATCTRALAEAVGACQPPRAAFRRHAAVESAIEALATLYPIVAQILTCGPFFDLAADFVADMSRADVESATYGCAFPEWIEQQRIGRILPYLSTVAAIDRLWGEAHRTGPDRLFARDVIAGLTAAQWSASTAKLHAATRFGWFAVPAPSIWLSHFNPRAVEPAPEWKAEGILLTRPAAAVQAARIGPAEHRILSGLRIGETIGSATAAADALYPQADMTRAVDMIIDSGAIASLQLKR